MVDPAACPPQPGFDPVGCTVHASCVARDGHGVLLLGCSGAGKSDLALRLLGHGFQLVSDDRVRVRHGLASPPDALAGLLELRGLGILRVQAVFPVPLALAVELVDDADGDRLPEPTLHPVFAVPLLRLRPWHASAPLKVAIALDCVLGRRSLLAGFVAPSTPETHD